MTSEHVLKNETAWTVIAPEPVAAGERCWAQDGPAWSVFGIPKFAFGPLDKD